MKSINSKEGLIPKITSRFDPCAGMMHWDSLDSFILAFTFIWAGLVFLSDNIGLFLEVDTWSLFFLGAGILVLIKVAIRLLIQVFRIPITGDLIWTGILFWLGGWYFILSLAIAAIGVLILYRVYDHKRVQVNL